MGKATPTGMALAGDSILKKPQDAWAPQFFLDARHFESQGCRGLAELSVNIEDYAQSTFEQG